MLREYSPLTIDQLGSFAEPMSLHGGGLSFPSIDLPFMAYAQSADVVTFFLENW